VTGTEALEEDSLDSINMEKRIDRVFPLIDIAPADGKIDLGEHGWPGWPRYQQ